MKASLVNMNKSGIPVHFTSFTKQILKRRLYIVYRVN